jgi:hypothetical protein
MANRIIFLLYAFLVTGKARHIARNGGRQMQKTIPNKGDRRRFLRICTKPGQPQG